MPVKKISELDEKGAAPATGDRIAILDVSDTTESPQGTLKSINASRVARTGAANTFTALQTIDLASNAVGLAIDGVSDQTSQLQTWTLEGVLRADLLITSASSKLDLREVDLGAGVGPFVLIRRNSNASTPAAGHIGMADRAGTLRYVWPDNTGMLRINTATPTNANDTAGTVVGTQTSWHGAKEHVEEWDGAEALDAIRALTLYSYQMSEDSQQTPDGEKPTYKGIVIMDEDREFNAWFGLGYGDQQVPALNDRNLFGYMLAAIRHGGNIINELQSQVAALTARVEALEGAE